MAILIKNILLVFFFIFFISGCSDKAIITPETKKIKEFPRAIDHYVSKFQNRLSIEIQKYTDTIYNEFYFKPWHIKRLSYTKKQIKWPFRVYGKSKDIFGENRKKIEKKWIKAQYKNANFEDFGKISKKAVSTTNANLRNFPTQKPLFRDFNKAGEGFPFDYLQNTAIKANEPLFVSHFSADGAWVYAQNPYAAGWLQIKDIAFVDEDFIKDFEKSTLLVAIKDNFPAYANKQNFMLYIKTGTIMPAKKEEENRYKCFMAAKDINGNAVKRYFYVWKDQAAKKPLKFTPENIKKISKNLLGENYGWGGSYQNRDCSSMTKDFFAPFGIWLHRNSGAQKNEGISISLEDLSNIEKEKTIIKRGIPFLTLIYLKGHIMLYIGEYKGKPMVMHNTWGVKTLKNGKSGREIIGESIISTLDLGFDVEDVDKNSLLINRVSSMAVLSWKNATIKKEVIPEKLKILKKAYPEVISKVTKNGIVFKDGSKMIYDDKDKNKTFDELLNKADLEDQMSMRYPAGKEYKTPSFNNDPGRIRNEEFFKKIYGNDAKEVGKHLAKIKWLPSSLNKTLYITSINGVDKKLQAISNELDKLPVKYKKYINKPAGTFKWRKIAGTNRLSAHSFAIAIDINVKHSNYWRWDKKYKYRNKIPMKIVEIFEKHGFIWGGKWYHYDTMHFEYRPELLLP